MKKTLFVVDDQNVNLMKAEEALQSLYNVLTIPSGGRLLTMLKKKRPHLILLDIEMPEMDGFEVLTYLKNNKEYSDIPVIFLTSIRSSDVEVKGFEMGVVDFIIKPFQDSVLLNRVKLHIDVSQLIKNATEELRKSHKELERGHRNMILTLADIVENRDSETGGHIERTSLYIEVLLRAMVKAKVYFDEIKKWDLDVMKLCAMLHDVGKIGVSDTILNKPAKLSEIEFTKMKGHVLNGASIIDHVIQRNGEDEFLRTAVLFAEFHHEKWDGTGYPHGLRGLSIPLQGRIMAIADVYDALISSRPYKQPFPHENAVKIIANDSGKHFDPKLVDVFIQNHEKFQKIVSDNLIV